MEPTVAKICMMGDVQTYEQLTILFPKKRDYTLQESPLKYCILHRFYEHAHMGTFQITILRNL